MSHFARAVVIGRSSDAQLPVRHEAVLVGVGGGRCPAGDAELGEDVLDVAADGVLADRELLGDLAVRLARATNRPSTSRSRAESRRRPPVRGPSSACDAFEVEARAQLGERRPGVVELERRAAVWSPSAAHAKPTARRCAPPRRACAATATRARATAARSARRPGLPRPRARSRRRTRPSPPATAKPTPTPSARARRRLRGRPEHRPRPAGSRRPRPAVGAAAADGRSPAARAGCWRRPRPVTARQLEQRQPGHRLVADAAGEPVRGVGPIEVADQPVQLGLLVVGEPSAGCGGSVRRRHASSRVAVAVGQSPAACCSCER